MTAVTAEQVKELSERTGISLHEAKRRLDKLSLLHQAANAKTIDDIKPILYKLIDEL